MAISSQPLSNIYPFSDGVRSYKALYDAKAPLLLAHNAIRGLSTNDLQWRSGPSFGSGAALTSGGSTRRLWDGFTHLASHQGGAGSAAYLMMRWTNAPALADFDSLALFGVSGINGSDDGFANIVLDVSENDFSTYTRILDTYIGDDGAASDRHFWQLSHDSQPRRYSGIYYARLMILSSLGTHIPEIGEVILGKRRSLPRKPDEPWDAGARQSTTERVRSFSGIETRSVHTRAQRVIDATVTAIDDNEAAEIEGFFVDCEHGTRPFMWRGDERHEYAGPLLTLDGDEWRSPYVGPSEREYRISAVEQGPHFYDLTMERV